MKLYHFTGIKNVEAIKRDGLQSWCSDDSTSMVGLLRPVVFLCNTPTAEETDWERAIVRERCPDLPILNKRWLGSESNDPLARFTVRLSSSDRKLKKYGPWLRKHQFINHPDPDDIFGRRAMETWFISAISSRRKSLNASSNPRRCLDELATFTRWRKFDGRLKDYKEIDPPPDVAPGILAQGKWKNFRNWPEVILAEMPDWHQHNRRR